MSLVLVVLKVDFFVHILQFFQAVVDRVQSWESPERGVNVLRRMKLFLQASLFAYRVKVLALPLIDSSQSLIVQIPLPLLYLLLIWNDAIFIIRSILFLVVLTQNLLFQDFCGSLGGNRPVERLLQVFKELPLRWQFSVYDKIAVSLLLH